MKIYANPISPPSRMVVAVANFLEIDFEYVNVDLHEGEHLKEDFEKVNPFKKIPAFVQRDFTLFESFAIMRYLCDNLGGDRGEYIFPRDAKKRAEINMYLG